MPIRAFDNIKGKDLPPFLLKKFKKSSHQLFRVTIQPQEEVEPRTEPIVEKGKWAKVVEEFKKNPLTEEARETLENASKEFRENFAFRAPPTFNSDYND